MNPASQGEPPQQGDSKEAAQGRRSMRHACAGVPPKRARLHSITSMSLKSAGWLISLIHSAPSLLSRKPHQALCWAALPGLRRSSGWRGDGADNRKGNRQSRTQSSHRQGGVPWRQGTFSWVAKSEWHLLPPPSALHKGLPISE